MKYFVWRFQQNKLTLHPKHINMLCMKRYTTQLLILLLAIILPCAAYSQSQKVKRTTPSQKSTTTTDKKKQTTTTNSGKNGDKKSPSTKRAVNTSAANGNINGHDYVDLGLSVKWATCNVGASKPSDYGNYYAWGETKTKSTYTESNSVTDGKSMNDIGGTQYDVAHTEWGDRWRLPTKAECQELKDKCKWQWTTLDGHAGYKVTGPNGNSIFLAAAGCRYGDSVNYVGSGGKYWSSTPNSDDVNACELYFFGSARYVGGTLREFGCPVRPVAE